MGGERGEDKGKRKRRERGGEGERKKGVGTVGLKPSQSKIPGYVTGRQPCNKPRGAAVCMVHAAYGQTPRTPGITMQR